MDFNKLTRKSQEAIAEAQNIAAGYNHQQVDVEHVLLALLRDMEGLIPRLLKRMEVEPTTLEKQVEAEVAKMPRVTGGGAEPGKVYVTNRLNRLLADAEERAKRLKDEYVSVEHLFLAMLGETNTNLGRILGRLNVTEDKFLKTLTEVRGSQRVQSADPEATYEALEKYGRDLVAAAREGKLDPVIGRDEEVRRVIRILSRKTKNNP
ncbi:MAG: type VI secretion system ATPase TssH, partial [Synergistaceae bacterium]|nr:type VI secretion system ATPase TssH [Synergistaceae bacterium]